MRGNRYNTVDRNFDGAVPPSTGGNPSPAEIAKQRNEEQKKKQEELRQTEKARAIEFAKKRALANVEESKESKEPNSAPEDKNAKSEKPDEKNIHAEEKPQGKKIVWNPNSKYAGMGRVVQHVKPIKWASDKIINMGNRYADEEVEYDEDNFGFMNLVSKAGSKLGTVAKKATSSIANKTSSMASKMSSGVSKMTSKIKPPSLPATNVSGVVTSQATRNANKLANKGLTATSNVGSTIKGVLDSKIKSAAIGAGAGAAINAAQGKNPVTGALVGGTAGVAASTISKQFSFLDNMPRIISNEKELLRDKLIVAGYSKELSIIDKSEAGERKKDKLYLNSKKIVQDFLSDQRTKRVNLKGNRGMLLKKLSNPKEDKLYSSLSLLYFHCENSQEIKESNVSQEILT